MPIALAHRILHRLTAVRQQKRVDWLRPDSKSQVTVEFDGDRPVRIDTVVVSTQHSPAVSQKEIRDYVIENVVKPVLPKELVKGDITYHINPTGRFVTGGPHGDTRADRSQDHRRYLRRLGPARGRGLQRQGPDQGRPQRGVHGPPRGEEHRGRRSGRTVRIATGVCDRRVRAGQRVGGDRGNGQGRRRAPLRSGAQGVSA